MKVTNKGTCGKRTGPNGYDFCYLKAGHRGKCFSSFGRRMEYIVQEVLRFAGRKVVSSNDEEDRIQKVDFWLECSRDECFLLTEKKNFVPIQFTIHRDAAHGEKGGNAMNGGVIIVWISNQDLEIWEETTDDDMRKTLALKITDSFLSAVDRAATVMNLMGVEELIQPPDDYRFNGFNGRTVDVRQVNMEKTA